MKIQLDIGSAVIVVSKEKNSTTGQSANQEISENMSMFTPNSINKYSNVFKKQKVRNA